MQCPKCQSPSRIYDTLKDEDVVLRMRRCEECSHKWGTMETIADVQIKRAAQTTRVASYGV